MNTMNHRSSRPEVFCKKSVLRNFAKFTGKHLCQRLLRTPFFTEHLRRLHLESLKLWIKREQRLFKRQDNYSKLNASLKLFTDEEGIFRLKGRFANSSICYDERHRSYFEVVVLVILRR